MQTGEAIYFLNRVSKGLNQISCLSAPERRTNFSEEPRSTCQGAGVRCSPESAPWPPQPSTDVQCPRKCRFPKAVGTAMGRAQLPPPVLGGLPLPPETTADAHKGPWSSGCQSGARTWNQNPKARQPHGIAALRFTGPMVLGQRGPGAEQRRSRVARAGRVPSTSVACVPFCQRTSQCSPPSSPPKEQLCCLPLGYLSPKCQPRFAEPQLCPRQ